MAGQLTGDRWPHDEEAERLTIGAILLAPEGFESARVSAQDFVSPSLRIIYQRIEDLHAADTPIDLVTVRRALRESGDLDGGPVAEAGGIPFLADLIVGIPRSANVAEYARPIRQAARARRIAMAAQALAEHQLNGRDEERTRYLIEQIHLAGEEPASEGSLWLPPTMPEPPPYLVKGVLPEGGKLLIVGQSGAGKSYIAYDLALAIITGRPWLGREEFSISNKEKGPVLIIDEENGPHLVPWRIEKLGRPLGTSWSDLVSTSSLYVASKTGFHTGRPRTLDWLKSEIRRLNPCLVIFDAAVRMLEGSDSDSDDVARFWGHLDEMARLGLAICVIHHAGWEASARPRGSTDWRAAVDVELSVKKTGDGRARIAFGKVREGREPSPLDLTLDFQDTYVRLSCTEASEDEEEEGKEDQTDSLANRIWSFVREGTEDPSGRGRRRSKTEVRREFAPDRKGKSQFYKATKRLKRRQEGARLVEDGDDYVAIA